MSFRKVFFASCASVFGFILVASAPLALAADLNTSLIANVSGLTPCSNVNGYAVSLSGAATTDVIYAQGFSQSFPMNTAPWAGEQIFLVFATSTSCATSQGNVLSPLIAFYEPTTFFSSSSNPIPPSSNGSGSNLLQSLGSTLISQLKGLLQKLFAPQSAQGPATTQSPGTNATGGSSSGGRSAGAGIGIFGGLFTLISPCDEGFLYALAGRPYSGPLMWVYGVSSLPPYLYAMGTPPITGTYGIGHYKGFSTCTLGAVTIGAGPIMYGYGTSLPNGGKMGKAPSTKGSGNYCKNPIDDAYTKQALDQYGQNMLAGNVPGLTALCPNYQSFTESQREDFWTRFVDAVETRESECKPGTISPESNGQLSEGLLQLSVGDSALGHPGACPLNSSNILDAQTNITCGVAIMDSLSPNGITNHNQGMDKYWNTLRPTDHNGADLASIRSAASSFPGCQ